MKKQDAIGDKDVAIYASEDEDPELVVQKKLSLLDRQVVNCDKQAITNAISIQGDLSYYLYEMHIREEIYLEYKSQLNSIVKNFLNKCNCKKD